MENLIGCHLQSHALDCSQQSKTNTLCHKADKKMKGVKLNLSSIINLGEKKNQNNQEKNPKNATFGAAQLQNRVCRGGCVHITKGNSWINEALNSQS